MLACVLADEGGLEFLQQLALLGGEVDRRLDLHLAVQVAGVPAAHRLHPAVAQAEHLARLGFCRDAQLQFAIQAGHADHVAERRLRDANRDIAIQVIAVALQTVESSLGKITQSMDDASRSLGFGKWATLRRVHIPMLRGSLLTASLLVFVDVMKELPATLVIRPFNFDTLATQAHTLAADERLAEASTAALIIVAVGLLPMFIIYWVSGVAETNRAPFDVVEGESEIVAGHMVEYSGGAFALFFLAEYANMILISFLIAIFFMGGWLSPIQGLVSADISPWINWIWSGGWPWLFLKVFFFASSFIWFRASFPRFRYDQIMRLGWKVFIPLSIVWIAVTALMVFFGVIEKGV